MMPSPPGSPWPVPFAAVANMVATDAAARSSASRLTSAARVSSRAAEPPDLSIPRNMAPAPSKLLGTRNSPYTWRRLARPSLPEPLTVYDCRKKRPVMCTVSQADGMAIGAEVGMGWESAVTHWVDNRGSIRDSADERIHVKALPGRRSGHRGRRGGGGVGLQGQRRGYRWRRRELNEASRKEVEGR